MHNINHYQRWTRTTIKYDKEVEGDYLTAGLVGEVGELFGHLAKFHRKDPNRDLETTYKLVKKELGDILYFIVRLADYYGWDASEIIQDNVNKLEERKKNNTLKGDGDIERVAHGTA